MTERVVLITGSGRGIGMETALLFASKGWKVIAGLRNEKANSPLYVRAKDLNVLEYIHFKKLDVTSADIQEEVKAVIKEAGRIDVLVNNAGYAAAGYMENFPVEELRQQFETNVFGVAAITQGALPYMRESKGGRIINISSVSGLIPFPVIGPYAASKHALEAMTESLSYELDGTGIEAFLLELGSFQTDIWEKGSVQWSKRKEKSRLNRKEEALVSDILARKGSFQDPHMVAEAVYRAATRKKVPFRIQVGKGIRGMILLRRFLPFSLWKKLVLRELRQRTGVKN
ncbi:SDR family NAD(P)-dependent oxidoreductase [Bacillus sp. FJAT-44742]|uniref:SDR family NAD(P)-dependent oxidoreductase n=1 Tax=Bacillus sp. FJAT-44742 TaxID=2014005 RepID=UPI000C23CDEC|nr:SDR family NAD(P)-dependent oxidoreductase [Bacillus sp. FJAT-44742]